MLLLGCDQAQDHATEQEKTEIAEQAADQNIEQQESEIAPNKAELKSGNIFYMVRDAANLQLKAGDYVEQLKDTQLDVEQAIQDKNQNELKNYCHYVKTATRRFKSSTFDFRYQKSGN